MWILTNKLRTSHFVADTKASELDLEQFSQLCEKSLWWRGKDSLARTWLKRCKTAPFMKHLSSQTLKPSHTEDFLEKWTSSLEDSPANLLAMLEGVKALTIQDTSSHTSEMESEIANQELFSSKTLKELSQPKPAKESQFSNMSCENWKDWVTEQRQEYLARKKLARHIEESACISLESEMNWATPQVMDASRDNSVRTPSQLAKARSKEEMEKQGKQRGGCRNLREDVMNWPTASVAGCVEGGLDKSVEMTSKGFKATRQNGISYGAKLRDAVIHHEEKVWPTIQARDWKATAGTNLERLNPNGKPRGTNGELPLAVYQEEFGPRDQANDNTNGKNQESQTWATPRANQVHPKITEENRAHLATRGKSNLEEEIAGHCGKATGKLNPDWVEQMMGLPVGWTQIEPTDLDC